MAFDDTTFKRIVSAVNEAVVEPSRWETVVTGLAHAMNANGAALFSPTPDAAAQHLAAASGSARDSLPEYAGNWLGRDPWVEAAAAQGKFERAGTVEFGRSMLSVKKLRRSAFHSDLLRRHAMQGLVSLRVCDALDGVAPVTHLSLFRPPEVDDFGEAERAWLLALFPYLRRAVHAHWMLRKANQCERVAEDALDALPQPAWIVREDATVDFANRAARDAMSSSAWLRTANGRLHAVGDLDASALRIALRDACMGGRGSRAAAIKSAGRLRCAVLHIVPLLHSPGYVATWPLAKALLVLCLPMPDSARTEWLQRVALKHRLTAAEARVLERLSAGLDPRAIAAELQVSYATVRTHLRMLYDKTGCRRQAELVLLASGA